MILCTRVWVIYERPSLKLHALNSRKIQISRGFLPDWFCRLQQCCQIYIRIRKEPKFPKKPSLQPYVPWPVAFDFNIINEIKIHNCTSLLLGRGTITDCYFVILLFFGKICQYDRRKTNFYIFWKINKETYHPVKFDCL